MIYSYQKHIDALRTVEIRLPEGDNHQRIGTELATIDDTTYVHVPNSATLPEQPIEIDVVSVTLTPELSSAIKSASPHARLINARVVEHIRSRYSSDDEIGIMRTAPSEEATVYNAWVEECRSWGREQKAGLGL